MTVTIDGTNGVTTPDVEVSSGGSASAPAITISGDTNTGIFFPAADTIAFAEGGAEAMRIDSSGNVGVGTSSPQVKLQVAGDVLNSIGASYGTNIYYDAGAATNKYLANGFGGVLTVAESGSGGFRFYTAPSNSSGAGANATITERARITSDGDLLVGTTTQIIGTHNHTLGVSASGTRTPISTLVNDTASRYAIDFHNPNGRVGNVLTTGSSTSYNTSSDYRLKENIAPMTGALDKVTQLRPCTWSWKVDGTSGQGFVAHELQEIVPECVTGTKDETSVYTDEDGNEQTAPVYQGVDTSFLVATMTAAIQELKAINDAQASRIETLEAKVAALEANT